MTEAATGAEPVRGDSPDGSGSKSASRYLMTKRGYLHPQKTYVWITLLIIGVMSLLYFVLGLSPNAAGSIPPALGGAPGSANDLYFHSIAIGVAALGVYLVFMAFDLDKYEPSIDFPISYRALVATIACAIGAFFYLRPIFIQPLAPVPLGLILLGYILAADVGGALLVQLYLLPAKIEGTYNPDTNRLGMIPKWKSLPSWKQFRKMDSAYWLTFVAVISAFIAGVMGVVAFWINYFVIDIGVSPGIFSGYIAWLGGASQFFSTTVGSHSHEMVMALLLGVVAVTTKRFGVLNGTGWKRTVSKLGMWVGVTGLLALTTMFILEAFTTVFPNGVPPSLFGTTPGGQFTWYSYTNPNGMAADDTTMLWAALGGAIVLVPLLFTSARGRPMWKDPLRAGILMTWIFAFITTPLEGFYIEFRESALSGAPQDVTFGNLQYFALIGIMLMCMALLCIDFYVDRRGVRSSLTVYAMLSVLIATVGGYVYIFLQFQQGTAGYWVFIVGFFLMDLFLIAAMVAVYLGVPEKFAGAESVPLTPEKRRPASPPSRPSGDAPH